MTDWIREIIDEKKDLIERLSREEFFAGVEQAGRLFSATLQDGHKILTAGNGGSAADAQHFTGEVVGRFLRERRALAALTLTVDPAVMTAVANDYGYEASIARQIEGLGVRGDAALLISTSGNSTNLIKAAGAAKRKGLKVVGLLGGDGGALKDQCDVALVVPSDNTPRIQEIHTFCVHLLCAVIEEQCHAGQCENHRN